MAEGINICERSHPLKHVLLLSSLITHQPLNDGYD